MPDYNKLCYEKFIACFPELLNNVEYSEMIEEAIEIGAHILYEDVFCAYVLKLIDKKGSEETEKKIEAAFNLIEELVNHENFDVRNVAEVSFIERFVAELEPMKDVEKYLGPTSLRKARIIAHKWFGYNPFTWEKEESPKK